ncbi:MAG: insulinase family protein, partial [Bdellovibrio sp.]
MRHIIILIATLAVSFSARAVEPTPPSGKPEMTDVVGAIKGWTQQNDLKISLPVTKFTLANGLTVLLVEDHAVPM